MAYEMILTETVGRVAIIRLNRPKARSLPVRMIAPIAGSAS